MTTANARDIATVHMFKCNPSNWSGQGIRPNDFSSDSKIYPDGPDREVVVKFDANKDGVWEHCVMVREKHSKNVLNMYTGYGIDSIQNLTDTILDLCNVTR